MYPYPTISVEEATCLPSHVRSSSLFLPHGITSLGFLSRVQTLKLPLPDASSPPRHRSAVIHCVRSSHPLSGHLARPRGDPPMRISAGAAPLFRQRIILIRPPPSSWSQQQIEISSSHTRRRLGSSPRGGRWRLPHPVPLWWRPGPATPRSTSPWRRPDPARRCWADVPISTTSSPTSRVPIDLRRRWLEPLWLSSCWRPLVGSSSAVASACAARGSGSGRSAPPPRLHLRAGQRIAWTGCGQWAAGSTFAARGLAGESAAAVRDAPPALLSARMR